MTSTPRPRDAAATRADLLRAATRRFTLYGYERTTTREIAATAGVNVSLIARYFGSKDGLYTAVLEASAGSLEFRGSGNPVDDLLDGLRPGAWPEYGDEHPLLLLLRTDVDDARTVELRRRTVERALGVLSGSGDTAGLGDDPTARLRGATALALLAGIVALRAVLDDDTFEPDDDAVRSLLTRTLAAIAQPPADTPGGDARGA